MYIYIVYLPTKLGHKNGVNDGKYFSTMVRIWVMNLSPIHWDAQYRDAVSIPDRHGGMQWAVNTTVGAANIWGT